MSQHKELTVNTEAIYVSASANRLENGISILGQFLLYSRCNSPILYNIEKDEVSTILVGHSQQINGLKFVHDTNPEEGIYYIISTSYDQTAIIWKFDGKNNDYLKFLSFSSPDREIFTTRTAIRVGDHIISITSTISGLLILWRGDEEKHKLDIKYVGVESKLHGITINRTDYFLLFLSGSDNNIHVFQVSLLDWRLHPILNLWAHDDWIKSLDTINIDELNTFLLAGASQDCHVKVWQCKLVEESEFSENDTKRYISQTLQTDSAQTNHRISVTLETNMHRHDGIVSSLCWFPSDGQSLRLASCSADKKIIVWSSSVISGEKSDKVYLQDSITDSWKSENEFGETGETNLPFVGVCVSHSSDRPTLYAQSLRGAIHSWTFKEKKWLPNHSITGHHDTITDLSWDKDGRYLISGSLDKTCRIHAISILDGKWHEIARPQVHGHEINCLASLNFSKFISGAEEKTIRAYGATQFFIKNFIALAKESVPAEEKKHIDEKPKHAQLPALGLSIRGADSPYEVEGLNDTDKKANIQGDAWLGTSALAKEITKSDHLEMLPTEEVLTQSTLWWETNKLFGHGNELHSLAVDSKGYFLASASRSNRPELASVIVWECLQFRKVATITHHSLTVTRLRFSPNDRYLLSVSRDRTWCISARTDKLRPAFQKLFGTTKRNGNHERIIWDCCWTNNSEHFMTISREKKAILWSMEAILEASKCEHLEPEQQASKALDVSIHIFDQPIQAVEHVPTHLAKDCEYLFLFGLENGSLELYLVGAITSEWRCIMSIPQLHHLPIKRLALKPMTEDEDILLASAGDDGILKLLKLSLS